MQTPNFELLKVDERQLTSIRDRLRRRGIVNSYITFLGRQRVGGVVMAAHLAYTTIKEENWNYYQRSDVYKFVLLQGYIHRILEIKRHENRPPNINQAVAIIEDNSTSFYKMTGGVEVTDSSLSTVRRILSAVYRTNSIAILLSTNLNR